MCTVKGNPLDYLEYASSLHKNLQFTLETTNGSGDLAFLDLNINLNEDRKISCHVECCGNTHNVKWEILDACRGVEKLMTIEEIYIKKLKPQLNTRDEYRGRELTLKY